MNFDNFQLDPQRPLLILLRKFIFKSQHRSEQSLPKFIVKSPRSDPKFPVTSQMASALSDNIQRESNQPQFDGNFHSHSTRFHHLVLGAEEAPKEAPLAVENRDDSNSSTIRESEATGGKSLLEGNGFKVIKKIGNGSYSKVKVIPLVISHAHFVLAIKFARIFRT